MASAPGPSSGRGVAQLTSHVTAGRILALVGIVLVAVNLRIAVEALSPIYAAISAEIPITSVGIGILGTLPPICFALAGLLAPILHRRIGGERALLAALIVLTGAETFRALAGSYSALLIASVLAFAGMGTANVLLPPLVKKYFPDRIGGVTAVYVTVMAAGAALAPLVAVPLSDSLTWRGSLGVWSVVALVAVIPWIMIVLRTARTGHDWEGEGNGDSEGNGASERKGGVGKASPGRVWRAPLAWALAAVFAFVAINTYVMFAWLPTLLVQTAHVSPAAAGAYLGLYSAVGLPASLVVPILAVRLKNVGILIFVGVGAYVVGYAGLVLAPSTLTWIWVSAAGLGGMIFPLTLVLINTRTRTAAGAVALSGFVQGIGYGVAAFGPVAVGLILNASGSWVGPIVFLFACVLGLLAAGIVVSRPRTLEDEWGPRSSAH